MRGKGFNIFAFITSFIIVFCNFNGGGIIGQGELQGGFINSNNEFSVIVKDDKVFNINTETGLYKTSEKISFSGSRYSLKILSLSPTRKVVFGGKNLISVVDEEYNVLAYLNYDEGDYSNLEGNSSIDINKKNQILVAYRTLTNKKVQKTYFTLFQYKSDTDGVLKLRSHTITFEDTSTLRTYKVGCKFVNDEQNIFCAYTDSSVKIIYGILSEDFSSFKHETGSISSCFRVITLSEAKIAVVFVFLKLTIKIIDIQDDKTFTSRKDIQVAYHLPYILTENEFSVAQKDESSFYYAGFIDNKFDICLVEISDTGTAATITSLYKITPEGTPISFSFYSIDFYNLVFAFETQNNKKLNYVYSFSYTYPIPFTCKDVSIGVYSEEKRKIYLITLAENFSQIPKLNIVSITSGTITSFQDDYFIYFAPQSGTSEIEYFFTDGNSQTNKCTINVQICNKACSSCKAFSSDSSTPQCSQCQTNYYPIEDDISKCMDDNKIVELKKNGYYFDTSSKLIKKCFKNCKTCSTGGDENSHNCDSCKEGLLLNSNNCLCDTSSSLWYTDQHTGLPECAKECPSNFSFQIEDTNECVSSCPNLTFYVYGTKKCISSCPAGTFGVDSENICYTKCPSSFPYLLSTSQCVSKCPDDFPFVDGSNACVNSCPARHTTEKSCISKCSGEYIYEIDQLLECASSCPKSHKYLFEESNTCYATCPKYLKTYLNNCVKTCPNNTEEKDSICKVKQETVEKLIKNANSDIVDMMKVNPFGKINHTTYQIYNTTKESQEEVSKMTNVSKIDLGECESKLKNYYNIDKDEPLLIFKLDFEREDQLTNQVEYSVYSKDGMKLDLSVCENETIIILNPIHLNSSFDIDLETAKSLKDFGYDMYNSSDPFYTDVCTPYTSLDNTDVPLNDRKTSLYKNVSFCESTCEYSGINLTTMMVQCNCLVKQTINTTEATFSMNTLGDHFASVFSNSNIKVFKCINLVFDKKFFMKNIGNWVILSIFGVEIILISTYFFTGINPILALLNRLERRNVITHISNTNSHLSNFQFKNSKSNGGSEVITLRYLKSNPPRKEKYIGNQYFEEISDKTSSKVTNLNNENISKGKNKKEFSKKIKITKDSIKKNAEILEEKEEKREEGKGFEKDVSFIYNPIEKSQSKYLASLKCKRDTILESNFCMVQKPYFTDEEINLMDYKDAIIFDKRHFCKYYYSILKYDQLIIFTFFNGTDFNLRLLKISMFLFSFVMYLAFNTLFYSDSTMSHTYKKKGKFDFIYTLPKTIFSVVCTSIISSLLRFLSLSQSQIQKVKEEKDNKKSLKMANKFIGCIKLKIIAFFFLVALFLGLFWYYVTAFCSVYRNTQKFLIIDTITSFGMSMVYPFGICFFTAFFRILSLRKKSRCLYKFSKILQIF